MRRSICTALLIFSASLGPAVEIGAPPALARPNRSLFSNGARTIYEAIDLSSPRLAASTFFDAWARRDYATAHLVLSPKAQTGWHEQIARSFGMDTLFPGKGREVMEFAGYTGNNPNWDEIASDPTMLFDLMLRGAEEFDALPFSVGANYTIVSETTEKNRVKIEAETGSKPARLTVELVHLPSGRWKVDRILLPGTEPELKPWGYAVKK